MRPAGRVGADQDPAAQAPGQLRQGEPGGLDVVGGGVAAGVPGPQHDREGLAVPAGTVIGPAGLRMGAEVPLPDRQGRVFPPAGAGSGQAVIGWKPKVRFQVGMAWSFSEWAITIVASRSTVTRLPSAPGAFCPASAQARSRAAARAARIAFSARGPARSGEGGAGE